MKTLLLLGCLILTLARVQANHHLVTLSTDDPQSPQPGMLRYWINHATDGDTILFSVAQVTLDTTLRINGGIITIDGGNGVIVDGNKKGRVFNISSYTYDNIILKNLTIQNGYLNSSMAMGGGMYAYAGFGELRVENCTFINNEVVSGGDGQGGGLRTDGGTYVNCFFLNNTVSGTTSVLGGGGVHAIGGTFINCVIAGNNAGYGGGIFATSSSVFYNCTVTQNMASNTNGGGGINSEENCEFTNCIVFNNHSNTGSHNIYNHLSSSSFSHCAVESTNPIVGASGNMGLTATPFTHSGSDSLSLVSTSTCVEAGTTSGITVTTHDIKGNPRISGETIDIGAYEYKVPSFSEITVTNNSSSAAVEFSLPWAVAHADSGAVITFDNDYLIKVTAAMILDESVTIDGSGHSIVLDGDGKNHIFSVSGTPDDTVLLRNLWFQNGYTTSGGGAIFSLTNNGNFLNVINCVFENNTTKYDAGGAVSMFCNGSIVNCTFSGNKAPYYGGAVYMNSDGFITNCIFFNNEAELEKNIYGNGIVRYSAAETILQGEGNVYLWTSPFMGGSGPHRFALNSSSFCSNAGSPDVAWLNLPPLDAAGNQRIQNDTVDIGAFESSYASTPPETYSTITVSNNSSDALVENSLPWAIAHAGENCIITFNNNFTIPVKRELPLYNKNITIDGGEYSVVLDGEDSIRIFNIINDTGKTVTLQNLTVQNGYSCYDGGGILAQIKSGGNLFITNCFFAGNKAYNGGALCIIPGLWDNYGATIRNCVFTDNHAEIYGGGVYSNTNTFSTDDRFHGNSFFNCTFAGNSSNYEGGAILSQGNNYFRNCLFYNNPSPYGKSIWCYNGSEIKYCAADVNLPEDNNIKLYYSPFITGSFLLNDSSFCANAGTPEAGNLGLPDTDLAGNTRIINDTIDIGAYESDFITIPDIPLYDNITVTNNSYNVSEKNSLPWALMHATDSCIITFDNDYTIPVSSQIILGDKNITLDGGENTIILDGGDSSRIILVEGNLYEFGKHITLNNLTLQNGYSPLSGGGIYLDVFAYAGLTAVNCVFYNNKAYNGGGVYIQNAQTFINCLFLQNSATRQGGGAYVYRDVNFVNCTFTGNFADQGGGGIAAYKSNFTNNLIYGNFAKYGDKDVYDREENVFNYCASGDDLTTLGEGNLNLSDNPFKKGGGADSLSLKTGSVCVNAGIPNTPGLNLPSADYRGISRIVGDTVDIGAYEYYDHIIQTTAESGGQIIPGPAYVINERDQSLTVVPDPGYIVDSLWADDVYVEPANKYTFSKVITDHTLRATFVPDTFNVTVFFDKHGVVTPGDTSMTVLDTLIFTIIPDEGYQVGTADLGSENVLNELVESDSVYTYRLTGLTSGKTLSISFAIKMFTITTVVTGYGRIYPENPTVNYGTTISFSLIPEDGNDVVSVTYKEINMLSNLVPELDYYIYTLNNVNTDDTLFVDFTNISDLVNTGENECIVYPNPTSGIMHIKIPEHVYKYRLYLVDTRGIIKFSSTTASCTKSDQQGEHDIDLSALPPGNYIIVMEYSDRRISIPVIKE
ncbi:MAG: hypothetical protein JXB00_18640 [Bacteroidales bacterium]|nr:hypothetical protein [Bacteroidales bacterium]